MRAAPSAPQDAADARSALLEVYISTRAATERLAAPLSPEDQQLQSMPSASPTKWHLAHTSWFFEKLVLERCGVPAFDPAYHKLFNSYYEAFGPRHARPQRGLLSRPSAHDVLRYRHHVDAHLTRLVGSLPAPRFASVAGTIALGIAHEEQHQELILTDILHAFSCNPLQPSYVPGEPELHEQAHDPPRDRARTRFIEHEGGLTSLGCDATHSEAEVASGFCFDNETPRHRVFVAPFALADRLVTVAALAAFIRDGGYRTPALWLSDGLDFVRAQEMSAPLYTEVRDGELWSFSLRGERRLDPAEPVCHLSYYEADALARYLGARLPTEAEWEHAAATAPVHGNLVESGALHPRPAPARESGDPPAQLYGDVWEWTASSYEAYPGFVPNPGALAEYNAKFMVNQRVLRGGSCLTPSRHVRASYRNFWPPDTRFQMTGLRLARDLTPS